MAVVLIKQANLDTGRYEYGRIPYEQKDGHRSQREEPGIAPFLAGLRRN